MITLFSLLSLLIGLGFGLTVYRFTRARRTARLNSVSYPENFGNGARIYRTGKRGTAKFNRVKAFVTLMFVASGMILAASHRGGSANVRMRASKISKTNVRKPVSSNPPNVFKIKSAKRSKLARRPF
jgi:hypothetical protein